jgi:hypothetical protein
MSSYPIYRALSLGSRALTAAVALTVALAGVPSVARAGDDNDQGWKHGRQHGRTKHAWGGGHGGDWDGSPVLVYRQPSVIVVDQGPIVVRQPRPRVVYKRQPAWFSMPSQLNIVIPIQID